MAVNLDDIVLPLPGLRDLERSEHSRVWASAEGDLLHAELFPGPPRLVAPLSELGAVRGQFRQTATEAGGALVEAEPCSVCGLPALQVVIKLPQTPSGMTYVGSLVVPRRDFACVLKVECMEAAPTGVRDGAVFAREGADPETWMADPYDPSVRSPLMRNRSDDAQFDALFPTHPLSRARAWLVRIASSVRLGSAFRAAAAHE